jgi:serine/arginine repetitive matrix protein 2
MRALLEHSQQTFGPISAELRRIRSRTSSRASPYPQPQRAVRISLSPSAARLNVSVPVPAFPISEPEPATFLAAELALGSTTQVLRQRAVNLNTVAASEMSLLAPGKSAKGDSALPTQSCFGSNARRNTDGWPKRGVGKENKESSGMMTAYVPWLRNCLLLTYGTQPAPKSPSTPWSPRCACDRPRWGLMPTKTTILVVPANGLMRCFY